MDLQSIQLLLIIFALLYLINFKNDLLKSLFEYSKRYNGASIATLNLASLLQQEKQVARAIK